MTKHVRIENADTSDHPVRVTAQLLRNGVWVDESSTQLDRPTLMTTQVIYTERRLIVEERPAD